MANEGAKLPSIALDHSSIRVIIATQSLNLHKYHDKYQHRSRTLLPLLSIGRLPLLLIIITPAMWSANYLVARYAPGIVAPHLLAFLRWSMAFCLMLPFAYAELRREWPQWRNEWKEMIFLGALGMWICGAFVYIGCLLYTSPSPRDGLLSRMPSSA